MSDHPASAHPSPFVEISRERWASLADREPLPLTEAELAELRGAGDPIDMAEVEAIYRPLSRLIALYAEQAQSLHQRSSSFFGESGPSTPFVIGVAGSVAVGKSTVSRILRLLLSRWPSTPQVELVTTDGFLYPNAELERRGLMLRKGFPESYDRRALLRFVSEVKSGISQTRAPVYSHLIYDIVPDEYALIGRPDVLIIEGLNVLQPVAAGRSLALSDLFDFSIYVDARTGDIARWYEERFLNLRRGAFADPDSYFHRYASLADDEARSRARQIWAQINEPNLEQNIRPTRSRATLILRKGSDHAVSSVLLRKI